jgi:hypothetical protein
MLATLRGFFSQFRRGFSELYEAGYKELSTDLLIAQDLRLQLTSHRSPEKELTGNTGTGG